VGPIARRLVSNELFRSFFQAAPGLRELACLVKVRRFLNEPAKKKPFDLVIVDAPSTGHGLALLKAPKTAAEALIGPLKKSAESLAQFIEDPDQCALIIVTIPEEMPINEAIELYQAAKRDVGVKVAGVVLNGIHSTPWKSKGGRAAFEELSADKSLQNRLDKALGRGASSALLLSGRLVSASAEMSSEAIEMLATAGLKNRVDIPFIQAGLETEEGVSLLFDVLERGFLGGAGNGTG